MYWRRFQICIYNSNEVSGVFSTYCWKSKQKIERNVSSELKKRNEVKYFYLELLKISVKTLKKIPKD